jgi:hypothetical protein
MLIEEMAPGWSRIHDLIRLFASDQLGEQDGAAAAGQVSPATWTTFLTTIR